MTEKREWERFFDGHAPFYMQNAFTRNTAREADFILEELHPPAGAAILDIGCGTGRHAVELAKRGYAVTGVDISAGMLAEARNTAQEAAVRVEWIKADAAGFLPDRQFDAAICLCEGAFGLLASGDNPMEHPLSILRNVHAALKPGAGFVLTAPNAFGKIRKYAQKDVESGTFDPLTITEICVMEWDTPEGKKSVTARERGFTPAELALMCRLAGLAVQNIWGRTAGNWGRRIIDLDEIMLVARKPLRGS